MRPILLVEDNPDDVFFLKRAMDKAGIIHPIHVAQDGQEAIDLLQKNVSGHPDSIQRPLVVLLDLQLPRASGLDVLKWIREQTALRTLIVIIHSSSHLEVDIARAYNLGANSFLTKAASAEELLRMMQLLKAYWLELNAHTSGQTVPLGSGLGPSLGA